MGKIIYAFPGTGKTHYCKRNLDSVELSSEDYHWLDKNKSESRKGCYKEINSKWPYNYLNAIIEAKEKYKYVFITHSGLELCEKANIPYVMVYPSAEQKEEYIKRFKKRKNNVEFINNMNENYEKYILSCYENNKATKKYILKKNQYLEDIIKEFNVEEEFLLNVNQNDLNKEMIKTKKICERYNVKSALIVFNDKKNKSKTQKTIGRFYSSTDYHNIYLYNNYIIVQSFLGSANAAGLIEELKYYGIKNVFAIGSALKINSKLKKNLVLVQNAYIGEGTSKYYGGNNLTATSNINNEIIEKYLLENKIEFIKGNTFSTDAYYRESYSLVEELNRKNIISIDMECSCFATVSKVKNMEFSQILMFKDEIKNKKWKKEIRNKDIQDFMLNLGISIMNEISKN